MLWFLLSRDRNCFPSCYFLFVLVSVTIAIEWIVISARQSKQFLYLSTFRCNKWNWTYNNILHMKNDDFHPYFVSCFKWKKKFTKYQNELEMRQRFAMHCGLKIRTNWISRMMNAWHLEGQKKFVYLSSLGWSTKISIYWLLCNVIII